MSPRWLLIAVVAATACAHGRARKPGDEYLKDIKFEGNRRLSDKTLVAGLALHRTQQRGRSPDPYQVQVDADRIRGEYLRKGFLDVDVRPRVERVGDATTVTYAIEEGVRATTKVVINGLPPDPELAKKVREQIALDDGDSFDYEPFELAKQFLLAVVRDAGYAHAKLDATVYADRANHRAVIELDYTPGPICTFGKVEITGVEGDLAEAIRNRVAFEQGDRYSTTQLAATQRALYGMQRFSTVQVQPDEVGNGTVVGVKISVSEGARREIRLGGGFGIDPTAYEVRGRAGYTISGWPFPLDTVTLDLRPAYAVLRDGSGYEPRVRAVARLERQDFLWTYARGEVEAGYNYIAIEGWTSYGPRARLGFSTPLIDPRVQLRLGWGIEQLGFRNVSPLIDPTLAMDLGLDRTQRIGAYAESLVVDLRDHPIEPRVGLYAEVRAEEGTKFAGGNYDFVQVVPELRGYVPIRDVVLAARLRAGAFYGDVPTTERYFAGGASSQRGFGERRLSPYVRGLVDDTDRIVPYGGVAMIETGIEARIPITSWRKMGIGAVTFLDGGDVVADRSQLDPFNLHWAAGVGLRINTLVGPVRADLGYRLNRYGGTEPDPDSRFAFHISLGEAF